MQCELPWQQKELYMHYALVNHLVLANIIYPYYAHLFLRHPVQYFESIELADEMKPGLRIGFQDFDNIFTLASSKNVGSSIVHWRLAPWTEKIVERRRFAYTIQC